MRIERERKRRGKVEKKGRMCLRTSRLNKGRDLMRAGDRSND